MAKVKSSGAAYEEKRNSKPTPLQHHRGDDLNCVELFAGCGGMSMGLKLAGFNHRCLIELNATACETLRYNVGHLGIAEQPEILEQDVRSISWGGLASIDLVAGGPPCQPFSKGGLAAGAQDSRNMWPEAVRAVHELQPSAFVFENVKGLLRPAFSAYLNEVTRALARGERDNPDERGLYDVAVISVNAADYGVPQRRERVFVAGVRREHGEIRPFPEPTHSSQRLVWEKWVSGGYWEKHGIPRPTCGPTSRVEQSILRELERIALEPSLQPWSTCRDAFVGLGEPTFGDSVLRHEIRAGAKTYAGHDGSLVDWPAKALKAGAHGVPGGENVLIGDSGVPRYFSVREAARLQGMPDTFEIRGSWSQAMKQLGNAVPSPLANIVGQWIRGCIRVR